MDVENLERRCPRLGGPVRFSYCCTCSESGKVCFKILDCWWESFDVVGYLKVQLTAEEFKKLKTARPQPKVGSLLELIEKARRNTASSSH
ncbi:MAG: hypothetical protein PVI90_12820 [Desulfobacteraceae bacterium]|jgi:hypothetical protein